MINEKRNYVSWDKDLALAYAKQYKTQHDLKHYAHGCYQWLKRHDLLKTAFDKETK